MIENFKSGKAESVNTGTYLKVSGATLMYGQVALFNNGLKN